MTTTEPTGPNPSDADDDRQRAATLAETVGTVFAHVTQTTGAADTEDAVEIQAITDAMIRLFVGAPLRSGGQLTIKSLAEEADLRRNKLTHKHTGLKDLFYALVKAQEGPPKPVSDKEREKAKEDAKALQRVRAERDTYKTTAQQLARVVQVLEEEKQQLAEDKEALEEHLVAYTGVTELTGRRRRPRR
ncbi:hypothetical protein [Streptomyces sp. NPDC006879]|uniref:hypothetical protein n=1 Tax=Streptomyces sp. NPDC006879 TaxID=3364767 RepID=UPI00368CC297